MHSRRLLSAVCRQQAHSRRALSTVTTTAPALLGELSAFEQATGNTRLLYLRGPSQATGCNIFAKAEYENPGGSIKDRAALWMVRDAEERGILTRGQAGTIIEGTAGNTGIGLALAAAVFGYRCVIVIASSQSEEKKNFLRWAGAQLVEVPAAPYRNPANYVHVAARLAKALDGVDGIGATLYANQWDNMANRQAHIDGTGPEILQQLRDAFGLPHTAAAPLDAFSCAMGTGGTLTGVAQAVRGAAELGTCAAQSGKAPMVALTDPCGAALVSYYNEGELRSEGDSISEGIGQGRVTGNMADFTPDLAMEVHDEEMMKVIQDLQQHDGLCVGGSSGINVAGAIRLARELGPGHNLVTILCDQSTRYAAKLYNPPFLYSRGLPVPSWLEEGGPSDLMATNKGFREAVESAIQPPPQ